MSTSTNALVLPVDATSSSEAQTFPGFPGAYRPGVPVLLSTIGLDLMEARASIETLGLPLVEHAHSGDEEPPVPDANPPRHEGNLGFGEVAPGVRPVDVPEPPHGSEAEDEPPSGRPLTKAELVTAGEALGIDLDPHARRDDLAAAVEAAGGTSVAPPDPEDDA